MDFYKVGKNIGKGAFGRVNIAMQLLAGRLVAIKSIDSARFKDHSRKFMNEVSILKQARHKNIV
jgi:serine/threonine protein kinase